MALRKMQYTIEPKEKFLVLLKVVRNSIGKEILDCKNGQFDEYDINNLNNFLSCHLLNEVQ